MHLIDQVIALEILHFENYEIRVKSFLATISPSFVFLLDFKFRANLYFYFSILLCYLNLDGTRVEHFLNVCKI